MKHYKIIAITTVMFSMMFSGCRKYLDNDGMDQLPQFGSCKAVPFSGNLTQSVADNTYTYLTKSGGKILMDQKNLAITISHKDYVNFKIELWGGLEVDGESLHSANHENLNGKHIKDRLGSRRTIIFPDGTKFTLITSGIHDPLVSVSIHEGNAYHYINYSCKTLEYSSINSPFAQRLDDAEADGETGTFEITATGLLFYNIYIEDTPGNKKEEKVPLGEIYRDEPKRVTDYYDDPRLMNT